MDGQKRRPDAAGFPTMTKKAETRLISTNFATLFSGAELLLERKPEPEDGFRAKPDSYAGVEKHTKKSDLVRGQLITYAMHQHHQQPRVASYQLLFVAKLARIVRFDRAGVVCTELFDWTTGTILADFLSRFSEANRATRGHDTTVTPATGDDAKAASNAFIRAGYGSTHAVRAPYYKFAVPATPDGPPSSTPSTVQTPVASSKSKQAPKMHYYIAGCPISWSPSFTGRASTGYICYDLETKGVHFMKDAWRVQELGILAEYQVYALLGQELDDFGDGVPRSVPHVPTLMCGGDLRHADGTLQKTLTKEVFDEKGKQKPVQEYTHFRMVVKEVGKPLSTFKDPPELFTVLRDVVLGMWSSLYLRLTPLISLPYSSPVRLEAEGLAP